MNPLTEGAARAGEAGLPVSSNDSDERAAAAKAAARAAIDRRFDEEIAFLRELVRFPSTRGQTNGVQRFVAATLRELELEVDEVPVQRERIAGLPGFSPAEWSYDGLFQVVGRLPGASRATASSLVGRSAPAGDRARILAGASRAMATGGVPESKRAEAAPAGRSLILNGHVDVVSAEPVAHWTHDPWGGEIIDRRMYGRGACDMKGGVAAMIFAVKALQHAGIRLWGDVLVQTVLDEECGGNGTLALLAHGYRADAAVIPEPSGLGLSRAHLGVLWCRIRVRGRAAHAGSASRAVNAIEKGYVVYQAIKALEAEANRPEARHPLYADVEHPLNYNVGIIQGGDWPSSVPQECVLEVRLACFPGEDLEVAQARFRAGVRRATAHDAWLREHPPEVEFFGFRGEGEVYDVEGTIARTVAANHVQVVGAPLRVGVSTASDDRRIFQRYYGIPALCYGPAGEQLHAVDEWVELESVRTCTHVLAGVLIDWCRLA